MSRAVDGSRGVLLPCLFPDFELWFQYELWSSSSLSRSLDICFLRRFTVDNSVFIARACTMVCAEFSFNLSMRNRYSFVASL